MSDAQQNKSEMNEIYRYFEMNEIYKDVSK